MKKNKIIFFGSPMFSVPFLNKLIKNNIFEVSAIITEPDRPFGRGKKTKQTAIADFAKTYNNKSKKKIILFKPDYIKNITENIKKINPDLFVVVAYGQIIPNEIIKIPKLGVINVHPSDLPLYRGPAPIQYALLEGRKKTAVSIMKIDEKMDHGPILDKLNININTNDDYFSLENKIIKSAPEFLIKTLKKLLKNQLKPKKQNHLKATYTKLIKKSDGLINWNLTPKAIHDQIRAFCAWPKAYTILPDKKRLIFIRSKIISGKLKPVLIQLEGKKIQKWQEFIKGNINKIPNNILKKLMF